MSAYRPDLEKQQEDRKEEREREDREREKWDQLEYEADLADDQED